MNNRWELLSDDPTNPRGQEQTAKDPSSAICTLCPQGCRLAPGVLGLCRARRNEAGRVVDENYGRLTALALDPIEKKPLAYFRPGSSILSVGSYGCNLRCPFCQNASIAQCPGAEVPWRAMSSTELVAEALRLQPQGNIGIAYTYNEPLVGLEFVLDCAREARAAGLVNVLVSNGYVNPEPFSQLAPLIDAANIDLKGFTPEVYRELGGRLEPVKATIATLAALPSCHVELTTLIVPGLNDDPRAMDAEARWIASLDPSIPLHLTRFFPCYHYQDRPPTSVALLQQLASIASNHLERVVLGNC